MGDFVERKIHYRRVNGIIPSRSHPISDWDGTRYPVSVAADISFQEQSISQSKLEYAHPLEEMDPGSELNPDAQSRVECAYSLVSLAEMDPGLEKNPNGGNNEEVMTEKGEPCLLGKPHNARAMGGSHAYHVLLREKMSLRHEPIRVVSFQTELESHGQVSLRVICI